MEEIHSPKPWKWVNVGPLILEDGRGRTILQTFDTPSAEDIALIQAAPYLLRGCKMALDFYFRNLPSDAILSVEALQLRSVLEKAIKDASV